jgi:phosphohistidine phosphatase
MRTLILMRHGEAVDYDQASSDYARSLTTAGRFEVRYRAECLVAAEVIPQYIIASSALRTCETAAIMASFLSEPITLLLQPDLYQACAEDYLASLNQVPSTVHCVMIIGHNPAISALGALLSAQEELALPPSGMSLFQASNDKAWDVSTFRLIEHYLH